MLSFKCGHCYEIPTLCHIETTYKCNQNCIFCYNPRRAEKINYELLDKIVEKVAAAKIPHVYLSGGEPSLLNLDKINEYVEKLSINSSVTILTNGNKTMKGLSKKIACLGIPIHGTNAKEHDSMTQINGSYEKMLKSVKYYVSEGYDVRCILVLTGYNYDKMYELIKKAEQLGMESVYVDRYEDGGLGASNSKTKKLKPTAEQFRIALTQIIKAREDCKKLDGKVGFGTAIPFCLDTRLITENIGATCGVGTDFCAINSNGEFRICNQSEIVYGSILNENIKDIWKKRELNCFRNLKWVQEPCKSCKLLSKCVGGCKVDVNFSDSFCIDYSVRNDLDDETRRNIKLINSGFFKENIVNSNNNIKNYELSLNTKLIVSPYLKINDVTNDILCVTRYQTVIIDEIIKSILMEIKDKKEIIVSELLKFIPDINELFRIINLILNIGAVTIEVNNYEPQY